MADIIVNKPLAGQQVVFTEYDDVDRIMYNEDVSDYTPDREGDDFVLNFDDGGQVVFQDFYVNYGSDNAPSFETQGTVFTAEDYFNLVIGMPDLMPALGPGQTTLARDASNRSFDDMSLLNGIDRIGGLDLGFDDSYELYDTVNGQDIVMPGGTVNFDVWGPDGSLEFVNYVYEDGRPNQHLFGVEADQNWGEILMSPQLNEGTSISRIAMQGFHVGTQLEVRGANGQPIAFDFDGDGIPETTFTVTSPDQWVNFPPAYFEGEGQLGNNSGVFILPPADSDGDMALNTTVVLTAPGGELVVHPPLTIVVDAVADLPEGQEAGLDQGGFSAEGGFVNKNEYDETTGIDTNEAVQPDTNLSRVSFDVSTIFGDFADGSEQHFVLVEKPEGTWTCTSSDPKATGQVDEITVWGTVGENNEFVALGYQPTAGELAANPQYVSRDFFAIEVNNSAINPDGSISLNVTLSSSDSDSTLSGKEFVLSTGAWAHEENTRGEELTLTNNDSFVVTPDQPFKPEIPNLTVEVGWAYESANGSTYLEFGTGHVIPELEGKDIQSGTNADGSAAPLIFTLDSDSDSGSGTIDEIRIDANTLNGGSIVDATGEAYPISNGWVVIDGANAANNIFFKPDPTSHSDADIQIGYEVDLTTANGSKASYVNGTSYVTIDAVADISSEVEADIDGEASAIGTHVYEDEVSEDAPKDAPDPATGWDTDTFSTDHVQPVTHEFSITVSTTFDDNDGSEVHYVLLQKLDGWELDTASANWPAGYELLATTYTDNSVDPAVEYHVIQVPASVAGDVNADFPVKVEYTGDLDATVIQAGSWTRELNFEDAGSLGTGRDPLDITNDEAARFDGSVTYSADVVNSGLEVKVGWAVEGNNDAKHLGSDSTSGVYEFTGDQAEATTTDQDGKTNLGAPIDIKLSGSAGASTDSSAEFIDSLTFTYNASEGSLEFPAGWLVEITAGPDANGVVTISVTNIVGADGEPLADLTGLILYVPKDGSFSDLDVELGYTVTVKNEAGSSVTFQGGSVIAIDAVADMADSEATLIDDGGDAPVSSVLIEDWQGDVTQVENDSTTHDSTTGWETDTFSQTYEGTSYTINVVASSTFYDLDGSEHHYILVQQPGTDWTVNEDELEDGYTYVGTHTGADGNTYFKIEVNDSSLAEVTVTVPLVSPELTGDYTTEIYTGSLVVEKIEDASATGYEYDKGFDSNNYAENINEDSATYTIEVVDSTLTVKTGWASEGNNDAQHKGMTSDNDYQMQANTGRLDSTVVVDGSIAEKSKVNIGAPIDFSISGDANNSSAEFISSITLTADTDTVNGQFVYKNADGDYVKLASGEYTIDGFEYDITVDGNKVTITLQDGQTGGADNISNFLVFQPAGDSDGEVVVNYTVVVNNAAGSEASFSGTSSIVIDAVADKPTSLDVNQEVTDSEGTIITGTDHAAQPGEAVTITIEKVTFGDYLDGSEKHFIVVNNTASRYVDGQTKAVESSLAVKIATNQVITLESGDYTQTITIGHDDSGKGEHYKTAVMILTDADGKVLLEMDYTGKILTSQIDGLEEGQSYSTWNSWAYQIFNASTAVNAGAFRIPVLNELLEYGDADGVVSAEFSVVAPTPTDDGTIRLTVGGCAQETTPTNNVNSEMDANNNTSRTDGTVEFDVAPLTSQPTIAISDNSIFENLTPNAHVSAEDLAAYQAAYNKWIAGDGVKPYPGKIVVDADGKIVPDDQGAVITVGGISLGETAKIMFTFESLDGENNFAFAEGHEDDVMRLEFVDGDGNVVIYEIREVNGVWTAGTTDVNGDWTAGVEVPGLADSTDATFVFKPGYNYNSSDIKVDYSITVTEDKTGQTIEWQAGDNDNLPEQLDITVDAVAQQAGLADTDADYQGTGGTVAAIPGGEFWISSTITFEDFTEDAAGSEVHYILVQAQPGWELLEVSFTDSTGQLITLTLPANAVMISDGNGMYYRVPVSNEAIADLDGKLEVTVKLDSPANAKEGTEFRIGAQSWENNSYLENQDDNITLDNNLSYSWAEPVKVHFDRAQGGKISVSNTYEDLMPGAHKADFTETNTGRITFAPAQEAQDAGREDGHEVIESVTMTNGHAGKFILEDDGSITVTNGSGTAVGSLTFADSDSGQYRVSISADGKSLFVTPKDGTTLLDLDGGSISFEFTPAPDSDVDFQFGYTIKTHDPSSGDSATVSGNGTLVVDAVADKPDMTKVAADHDHPIDGTDHTFEVPISATFHDVDGSENHYVLVEVKANMTIYDAAGEKLTCEVHTERVYENGQVTGYVNYYMVPVDACTIIKKTTVDGSISYEVEVSIGMGRLGVDHPGEIKIGALATEPMGGGELCYHNNVAFTDGGAVAVDYDHGGGHIWVDFIYENNTPNAHLGDPTEIYGKVHGLGYNEPDATFVELKLPAGVSLVNSDGNAYTPGDDGVYRISSDNFDNVYVKLLDGYAYDDTDISAEFGLSYTYYGIEITDIELAVHGKFNNPSSLLIWLPEGAELDFAQTTWPNGVTYAEELDIDGNTVYRLYQNGGIKGSLDAIADILEDNIDSEYWGDIMTAFPSGNAANSNWQDFQTVSIKSTETEVSGNSGNIELVVDAVAQKPTDLTVSVSYGEDYTAMGLLGNQGNEGVAYVTISGTFTDTDGSETHYALIEHQPGFVVEGAESVYLDGKAYYRVPMEQGESSVTVTVKVSDPNALTDGGHSLNTGIMTVDKPTDDEARGNNNISWTLTDNSGNPVDAELVVSIVESKVSVSIPDITEDASIYLAFTGEIIEGEELVDFRLDPNGQGTLVITDASGNQVGTLPDGVSFASGALVISDLGVLQQFLNGDYKVQYTPSAESDKDVQWTITSQFKDTASGDVAGSKNAGQTMVIDAVADEGRIDDTTFDDGSGYTAVKPGEATSVDVSLHFDDTDGSELHYAVLKQSALQGQSWQCTGVQVWDEDAGEWVEATLTTVFAKDGTPYYGVLLDGSASDVQVRFLVTAPNGSVDTISTLQVGSISVETNMSLGADGEFNLMDNQAENFTSVQVGTGLVTTTTITSSGAGNEDDYCPLSFSIDGENETLEVTIAETQLAGGSLWVWDADSEVWNKLDAVGGNYVLSDAANQKYAYKAAENTTGSFALNYSATVTDTASGDEETFTQSITVTVLGVADGPSEVSAESALVPGTHMVTVTLSASFADVDGSESHYFLVKVPAGLTLDDANYQLATEAETEAAEVESDETGTWYKIPADSDQVTNVEQEITLTAEPGYKGGVLSYVAMAEENGNYASSSALGLQVSDLNTAPQGLAASVIAELNNAAATMQGTLYLDRLFSDAEPDDQITPTTVSFGNTTLALAYLGDVFIDGQHGTLTVTGNGDGTYTYNYVLHSDVKQGDSDIFRFSGEDAYGGSTAEGNEGTLTFTFSEHHAGAFSEDKPVDVSTATGGVIIHGHQTAGTEITGSDYNDTIYGGEGDDDINGGAGDDIIYAGAGNNTIFGGAGDDMIYAGSGNDIMDGGEGNDLFVWTAGNLGGEDVINNFTYSGWGVEGDRVDISGLSGLANELSGLLSNLTSVTGEVNTFSAETNDGNSIIRCALTPGQLDLTLVHDDQTQQITINAADGSSFYQGYLSEDMAQEILGQVFHTMNDRAAVFTQSLSSLDLFDDHQLYSTAGNDVLVYSPEHSAINGGDGIDFLIASGANSLDDLLSGGTISNVEVIVTGDDAISLTSLSALSKVGLSIGENGLAVNNEMWTPGDSHTFNGTDYVEYSYNDDNNPDLEMTIFVMQNQLGG